MTIAIAVTGWIFTIVVVAYLILFTKLMSWIKKNDKDSRRNLGLFSLGGQFITLSQLLNPKKLPRFVLASKAHDIYIIRLLLISAVLLFLTIIALGILQKFI